MRSTVQHFRLHHRIEIAIIKYLNRADKTLDKSSVAVSIRAKKSLGSPGRYCHKKDHVQSR